MPVDTRPEDDLAIRLRMDGLSFAQMAPALGLKTADGAMSRYRAARARQIPPEHLPRPHPRPSGLVIAWAAGFFDGEGCIFGYEGVQLNSRYRRFGFGVTVAQIVRAPLDVLAEAWGGAVHAKPSTNPRHSDQFLWGISGREAATFLADALPHLRVKRVAAEVALPVLFRTKGKGGGPYSETELAERRAAVATLSQLNSRKGGRHGAKEVRE